MRNTESKRRSPRVKRNLYLVGEGTGETMMKIARAALAQFNRENVQVENFFLVTDESYVARIIKQASEDDALVAFSIVQPDLRDFLMKEADRRG